VINAGVGGYRSIHLKRYYEKVIRPYEPDVITVYEGWNDFEDSLLGYWAPGDPFGHALTTQFFLYGKDGASWLRILRKLALFNLGAKTYFALTNKNRLEAESAAATNFLDGAKRDAWIAEYYKNISALVKEALDDGVLPVIINPASPVFELASGEVRAWADEDLNMNGRWDAFVLARKRIYETNKRIATENQIPLVEVNKAFDRYNADYRSKFALFTDRFHLTNEGNKLIAETLAPQLLEILRQKRTDSPRTGAL
jgi:lysophospholipase L1-like esterase